MDRKVVKKWGGTLLASSQKRGEEVGGTLLANSQKVGEEVVGYTTGK